ncbi:hypothetical protein Dimus_007577, partial [Dionaea muscipula]
MIVSGKARSCDGNQGKVKGDIVTSTRFDALSLIPVVPDKELPFGVVASVNVGSGSKEIPSKTFSAVCQQL